MSCSDSERIDRYLEGELDAVAREEFERHLDLCPACRRAVNEWRLMTETAASLPPLELPPDFCRRVMDRIEGRPRTSVFGWLALGSTAFVSLAAVVVGVLVVFGHSLTELVAGLEGFLVTTFKNGAMLFGQATTLITQVLSVLGHFLSAFWDGLSGLASVVPLPLALAILAVQVLIIASSIYGLRKILIGVRS